jgi:hypothetical protein
MTIEDKNHARHGVQQVPGHKRIGKKSRLTHQLLLRCKGTVINRSVHMEGMNLGHFSAERSYRLIEAKAINPVKPWYNQHTTSSLVKTSSGN